jgi:hypothetical protein
VLVDAGSAAAAAGFAVLFIGYFVVIIGSLVMTVVAIVDIAKRPDWQWKLARQEKILWLLLVIFVDFFAIVALIYWFNIRKKLIEVERAAAAGQFEPAHLTYGGWEPAPIFPPSCPPGWFPDPGGQHQFRWWDGVGWTDQTWNAPTARTD